MDAINGYFNTVVDISLVVFARLAQLPVLFVLGALAVGVSVVFALRRLLSARRADQVPLGPRYMRALVVTLAVGAVTLNAQRIELLIRETRELQYLIRMDTVHRNQPNGERSAGTAARRLIDRPALERGLESLFGDCSLEIEALGRGVEFAAIRTRGLHPTASFIAVIDLTDPDIRIEITDEVGDKRLTSHFGEERKCVVAVNGEAGVSPARDAALGHWQGDLVANGHPVLVTESISRPLLCFDRDNRGRYVPARSPRDQSSEKMYNVIWGRKDLLLDGVYSPESDLRWLLPNPRTLMGIDADGDRLILMVVDGRQPGYSVGLTLEMSAGVMRLFGANDAMWCDQGGSSTMYLGCLPGIINRPSDGKERPTYTHFGIGV